LGEGRAIDILINLGLEPSDLKASIEEIVPPSGGAMTTRYLPLTARAKRALEVGGLEAQDLHTKDIEGEHILLALLRDEEGVAARVLSTYEIDYKQVYEELQNISRGVPSSFKGKRRKP
jgi:ATP-dependent Clp protease ATP-binding subunit ClpC